MAIYFYQSQDCKLKKKLIPWFTLLRLVFVTKKRLTRFDESVGNVAVTDERFR